jgi:hypothetical protein
MTSKDLLEALDLWNVHCKENQGLNREAKKKGKGEW